MRELVMAAERLRQVRKAHERFLALWATECLMNRREALEQMAEDTCEHEPETSVADPFNRDWTLLYRGSILDD